MIDVKEHIYHDDPNVGHPDVRTELKDAAYFFLGNGHIQAAVQAAPGGDGTPLGLLIMDPERLRKKREALTMDERTGLDRTAVRIAEGGRSHRAEAGAFTAAWAEGRSVPTVVVRWRTLVVSVEEYFFCPDVSSPVLARDVVIANRTKRRLGLRFETGVRARRLEKSFSLDPGASKTISLKYVLSPARDEVVPAFSRKTAPDKSAAAFWTGLTRLSFGHKLLDRYFEASRAQLPAMISGTGRLDGAVWQYNREWLRDQAVIALAMAMLGAHDRARTMFHRLIDKFVTDEGDTVDLAPPFPQVGILPWTWAEIVILFVHHILGVRPEELGLRIRPRLLSGLKGARATLPFQNGRLELEIGKAPRGAAPRFRSDTVVLESGPADALLAYPGRDFKVEARVR